MKKKNKKIREIHYSCDNCGKQAVYNRQEVWKLFRITNNKATKYQDKFELEDEWDGNSNEFFCKKCYEKEISLTN